MALSQDGVICFMSRHSAQERGAEPSLAIFIYNRFMFEKRRLERVPDKSHAMAQDFGSVLDRLYDETVLDGSKSITKHPREYRIRRDIKPEDLEKMSRLSFEVMLTEHDAGTTLSTGTEARGWDDADRDIGMRHKRQARYTIHNHPNTALATPSFSASGGMDLGVSRQSLSEIDIIVGQDGLTFHKQTDDSKTGVDKAFSLKAKIANLRGEEHALKHDLQEGYVEYFLPFTDIEKMNLVCEYLNGTQSWAEYRDRIYSD